MVRNYNLVLFSLLVLIGFNTNTALATPRSGNNIQVNSVRARKQTVRSDIAPKFIHLSTRGLLHTENSFLIRESITSNTSTSVKPSPAATPVPLQPISPSTCNVAWTTSKLSLIATNHEALSTGSSLSLFEYYLPTTNMNGSVIFPGLETLPDGTVYESILSGAGKFDSLNRRIVSRIAYTCEWDTPVCGSQVGASNMMLHRMYVGGSGYIPSTASNGDVAFVGRLSGSAQSLSIIRWKAATRTLVESVKVGQQVDNSTPVRSLGVPSINRQGEAVFFDVEFVPDPQSLAVTSRRILMKLRTGKIVEVIRDGSVLSDGSSIIDYPVSRGLWIDGARFTYRPPDLNDNGELAFTAIIEKDGISHVAVLSGRPGELKAVITESTNIEPQRRIKWDPYSLSDPALNNQSAHLVGEGLIENGNEYFGGYAVKSASNGRVTLDNRAFYPWGEAIYSLAYAYRPSRILDDCGNALMFSFSADVDPNDPYGLPYNMKFNYLLNRFDGQQIVVARDGSTHDNLGSFDRVRDDMRGVIEEPQAWGSLDNSGRGAFLSYVTQQTLSGEYVDTRSAIVGYTLSSQ